MTGGSPVGAGEGLLLIEILPWLGLLVLLILVGGAVAVLLRRRMAIDTGPTIGFTLGDLRAMRDKGEISEEEFEQAREKMVRAVRGEAPDRGVGAGRPQGDVPPRRALRQGPRNPRPDRSDPDSQNH